MQSSPQNTSRDEFESPSEESGSEIFISESSHSSEEDSANQSVVLPGEITIDKIRRDHLRLKSIAAIAEHYGVSRNVIDAVIKKECNERDEYFLSFGITGEDFVSSLKQDKSLEDIAREIPMFEVADLVLNFHTKLTAAEKSEICEYQSELRDIMSKHESTYENISGFPEITTEEYQIVLETFRNKQKQLKESLHSNHFSAFC
ncbi:hypothetical protein PCE1_004210 [Barthelona sp. PCE]